MRLEIAQLLHQHLKVHDGAGTDDALRVRVEDARRHEVELEGAVLIHDGVPRVVATLISDDHVRLLREEVGDLSLALVAPLGSDDGGHGHVNEW